MVRKIKKYYSLEKSENAAELYIYGDIASWKCNESDVSSYTLSRKLAALEAENVVVYINSYGGEIGEGLAIYNALRRHGHVTTVVDGFAASIASVIAMAGDERVMQPSSLLYVHNAWTNASGDASVMREEAENLDKINAASVTAYMERVNIGESELRAMLDRGKWLTPDEAVTMGFATSIAEAAGQAGYRQSARGELLALIKNQPKPENELTNFLRAISNARKGNT